MYITGPAIVTLGSGPAIYFEDGLDVKFQTATNKIVSDMHGTIGETLKSRKAMITGKPEGVVTAAMLAALIPYADANIGSSLFTGTDVPLVIQTLAGQTITWSRACLSKSPNLSLSANKPLYGSNVEFTALGGMSSNSTPTSAAHFNAVVSNAFADTSYDPSKLIRDVYTAAYGSTPYSAMTAQEGFDVTIEQENKEIPDDNVGIGDIVLASLTVSCKFIPSNLNEAQLWTLLAIQNTGAVTPGTEINGGAANNLVITGSNAAGLVLTINKPGFKDADVAYKTGKLRAGEIMAVSSKSFTAGVAGSLISWTIL